MKPNSVKSLFFFINKMNGYIKGSNGDKYLTLVPANVNKYAPKNMKNYGIKSDFLSDQQAVTQMTMIRNI